MSESPETYLLDIMIDAIRSILNTKDGRGVSLRDQDETKLIDFMIEPRRKLLEAEALFDKTCKGLF